jgi:DNA-directed RNA polymerase subunit K/omega
MEQLEKRDLLKHAKNEYLGAMLAAKVARRLHAMDPEDRPDPKAKVTSLALKLITEGDVEYDIVEPEGEATDEKATRRGASD